VERGTVGETAWSSKQEGRGEQGTKWEPSAERGKGMEEKNRARKNKPRKMTNK